jgi:hypothetical protein
MNKRTTYPLELLVRQTHAILHADLITDATLLAEDRDALHLDTLLDNAGGVAAHGDGCALHTSPGTDTAAPADDRVHDAGVVADLGVLKDNRVLDTSTGTDHDTRADRNVRTELGGGVDGGGGVDVDRGNDSGGGRSELGGLSLECLLEVESVSRDGGAGGLDLTPEVLGFVDEEAVAVSQIGEDILFQTKDLALRGVFVVCGSDEGGLQVVRGGVREEAGAGGAALDGAADSGENAFGSKEIDAAVDQVGDVRFGFLDVVQHSLGVRVGHNASKVRRGVVRHPCTQNHRLSVLLVKQSHHLAQRERAADVGVQHKQALGLALEDRITEVVQATCGAQSCVLSQVEDAKLGEFLRGIFDEVPEYALVVVTDQNHFAHIVDLRHRLQTVVDDGVTGDFE